MKNSKNLSFIIGSLVVGTLTGAALGILFAPRKGRKTRNRLARRVHKIAQGIKRKMNAEERVLIDQPEELYDFAGG